MATTRTRFAGKALSDSWESEEREHPQGCSFFCVLSSAAALLGLRAHRARGFCSPKGLLLSLHRAGGESKGSFSFAKENDPFVPFPCGVQGKHRTPAQRECCIYFLRSTNFWYCSEIFFRIFSISRLPSSCVSRTKFFVPSLKNSMNASVTMRRVSRSRFL